MYAQLEDIRYFFPNNVYIAQFTTENGIDFSVYYGKVTWSNYCYRQWERELALLLESKLENEAEFEVYIHGFDVYDDSIYEKGNERLLEYLSDKRSLVEVSEAPDALIRKIYITVHSEDEQELLQKEMLMLLQENGFDLEKIIVSFEK